MVRALKIVIHSVLIVFLSLVTQIGGLIYLITLFTFRDSQTKKKLKQSLVFISLYLGSTYFIVPQLAPFFGREKIVDSNHLEVHSWVYKLCNRDYVTSELHSTLHSIADNLNSKYPKLKLIYLDANFPFIDGFPLLPHLSHNDGKKIDVTFIYEDSNAHVVNLKPSRSGYGIYENPRDNESNQTEVCKSYGYWQYDFPKYLSLGKVNADVQFSKKGTKDLIIKILEEESLQKLFIEPHLKNRLDLSHSKIRFHGCQAVRHDDHIHFLVK